MSRRLIAIAIVAAGGAARAQPAAPAPAATDGEAPGGTHGEAPGGTHDEIGDEIGDQGISAELGLATGGRVTPGGLRVAGHYLYQLSAHDWFDGAVGFTFGSRRAACFHDREDALVCRHGLSDGSGVELSASIRRLFAPQGAFRPFARAGVGLGLARFADDDVSGVTIALHGGGGVRVNVAPSIAVVAEGDLALGFGGFSQGLGGEPLLGLAITAGAEFRLR